MGLEQEVKLASWGFRSGGPGMASSPEPHSEGHGKTGLDSPKADMGREAAWGLTWAGQRSVGGGKEASRGTVLLRP